jgi:chromosome segregation ATPase
MKIKFAVVCVVAVAALALLVVQQMRVQDLLHENEALKAVAAQIAPLQEQLARATQEAANAGGGPAALEAQTRELARLRNEVSRLHGQTNELAKARQEIQTLNQRVASEAEARKGAAAVAVAEAQAEVQRVRNETACINALRSIQSVKQKWAAENGKQNTDTPTMEDLLPYLVPAYLPAWPVCPDGGVYTIGAVGEKPTCSIPGHALP